VPDGLPRAERPWPAFIHVALPALLRHIAVSALILFVIFLGDYGVPHACGLLVYSTELLGWATSSSRTVDVAWAATLPAAATLLALLTVLQLWRGRTMDDPTDRAIGGKRSTSVCILLAAMIGVSWLLPMGTLVVRLASPAIVVEALRTYAADGVYSLAVAALSGILAVGMGVGLVGGIRWAMVFGALPGALVGEGLVAAYNRPQLGWLYDHWPIVALAYIARFGWIGLGIALLVIHRHDRDLSAQARTDGATESDILCHLFIPMNGALLCAGVAVIAALSIADVAASSLVRVPTFSPIAHLVIEKFHRFEDGMLISLSLCLVSAAIPAALLLGWGLRRRA
jgi:ABC-type Fe3+ transport system permease subunit